MRIHGRPCGPCDPPSAEDTPNGVAAVLRVGCLVGHLSSAVGSGTRTVLHCRPPPRCSSLPACFDPPSTAAIPPLPPCIGGTRPSSACARRISIRAPRAVPGRHLRFRHAPTSPRGAARFPAARPRFLVHAAPRLRLCPPRAGWLGGGRWPEPGVVRHWPHLPGHRLCCVVPQATLLVFPPLCASTLCPHLWSWHRASGCCAAAPPTEL
mmetsp:Transcript_27724/g.89218  ORF Transcript_27724/g.89218 Transcript_27724/m.89218 type:complete len:209 (-) Transcript_27724:138-764(-)